MKSTLFGLASLATLVAVPAGQAWAEFPSYNPLYASAPCKGTKFALSQAFPTGATPPAMDPALTAIMATTEAKITNGKGWNGKGAATGVESLTDGYYKYLVDVRDYIFGAAPTDDWFRPTGATPRWFHIPWQHAGLKGREPCQGLTKEAAIRPGALSSEALWAAGEVDGPDGEKKSRSYYAIGVYNNRGGWAIGKVWANQEKPDLSVLTGTADGRGFPNGTVVAKVLTAQISGTPAAGGKAATGDFAKLPWLANPIMLEVYAAQSHDDDGPTKRTIQQLPVIQMDLMVRDERAPSKWIFATYVYNGQANPAATGPDRWKNLIPVGIQWGNDPEVTAHAAESNVFSRKGMKPDNTLVKTRNLTAIVPAIKQTTINPNTTGAGALPGTHLGWNGRLNGPADNLMSSCMSCHSAAQYPSTAINPQFLKDKADLVPTNVGDKTWMKWFDNHDCRVPFDPEGKMFPGSMGLPEFIQHWFNAWQNHGGAQSADCSLQLSEGIEAFYDEKMKTPVNDRSSQSADEY